jgi:hypothetical protein
MGAMGTFHPRDPQRPAYLRMLGGILATYALIIGFGDSVIGDPFRVAVFGWLVWTALRLRGAAHYGWLTAIGTAVVVIASTLAVLSGSVRLAAGVVGVCTFAMSAILILAIASTIRGSAREVDTSTVLGVLCIYLLLALLFSAIHQLFASVSGTYLHGAPEPPTSADLLYFSVITITTVGFGDITPASEVARAVTVVEALTGQLYLVSVVAAVIGGWGRQRAKP